MRNQLYDWQQACLVCWQEAGNRGIVHVATGAGKTVLALAAIERLAHCAESTAPLRVKIVVPKVFLAAQWRDALMQDLSVPRADIGLFHGSVKDEPTKPYMIYVLNSARYRLSRHILADIDTGCSVFLICDECHHFASAENSKVFDFVPYLKERASRFFSLGLSATPGDEEVFSILSPALGGEIYRLDLRKAVESNVVSDYSVLRIAVLFSAEERQDYDDLTERIRVAMARLHARVPALKKNAEANVLPFLNRLRDSRDLKTAELAKTALILFFQRKEIVYNASSRLDCACEVVELLQRGNKILLFNERIEAADRLYQRLEGTYPGRVVRYHSGMGAEARKSALRRYEEGEADILVCCKALDEGLNIPDTNVGIVVSSTGSARQRVQRVGRILRKSARGAAKTVYYLFLPESTESAELIEDMPSVPEAELRYDPLVGIGSETYFRLQERMLERDGYRVSSEELIGELYRNLRLGAVRLDYCLSSHQCKTRVQAAQGRAERNYWITMFFLAQTREEIEDQENRRSVLYEL